MDTKTSIYLIRHGETDWNLEKRMQGTTDIPLNDKGKRQALNIAKHIKKIPFHAIYSSPLSRAFKTASIIALHHPQVEIIKLHSLRERSFGVMEGKTQKEFDGMHPGLNWEQSWYYPSFCPPNGESLEDVYKRVSKSIKKILATHDNETIALISHGVTLRMIIGHLINIPIKHLGVIDTKNASLTIIEYSSVHGSTLQIANYIAGDT